MTDSKKLAILLGIPIALGILAYTLVNWPAAAEDSVGSDEPHYVDRVVEGPLVVNEDCNGFVGDYILFFHESNSQKSCSYLKENEGKRVRIEGKTWTSKCGPQEQCLHDEGQIDYIEVLELKFI